MRASGQAPRPDPGSRATGSCVLVVDDDRVIRELVADVFDAEGYMVGRAANGAEALDWLDEQRRAGAAPPAVILLDMRMPVMDGWAFAREYRRAEGPRAPIVVMTAAADAAAYAAEIGADGVLAKPFGLSTLLATVEAHAGALR
jgi:two-component system chemotaxis response regulator CheY